MENKGELKYISTIVFSLLIIGFVICYTMVSKADPDMDDLESIKQENEEQLSSYQEDISGLDESKVSLENLVSGLNSELAVINKNINDLEKQISDKNSEIEKTEKELESAILIEQEQYEDMKLRIQFMYELREDSYIEVFLSGGSIADSLNKIEYFSELTKYDRDMLEKYKQIQAEITKKEELLETEKQELEVLKANLESQKVLIREKINSTNEQIVMYASQIEDAEAKALEYEKKIEANVLAIEEESRRIEEESILEAERKERESREKASREQASREEASRNEHGGNEEETTSSQTQKPSYEAQADDLDMLAALIECEAGDQSYYGMLCVGAVVMNRIASHRYPNTLYEVIYQPYQFTPVTVSGRFAIVLARGANETCYKAAREVLEEGNIVGNWLFFRMNDGSREGEIIGDHVFY
ncbi:MAG: cell wall hydrolase [Lachnospiraceae bacterium]|nr:cell wall hydrolase [Lachnospiraceae bacterium]